MSCKKKMTRVCANSCPSITYSNVMLPKPLHTNIAQLMGDSRTEILTGRVSSCHANY